MARVPEDIKKKAEAMYRSGEKLVDIAAALGVPEGTIRSWKGRYHWNGSVATKNATKKRNVAAKEEKKRETVAADVRQVMENTELTEKQRLFCLYYIRCFNATRAYQKAYACSYEAAGTAGQRMLQNVAIKDEIQRLKQGRLNRELISEEDIVQKYIDIAFADITDYVEFGQEEVPIICDGSVAMQKDPETGNEIPATQKISTVRFRRDAASMDGSLISEVRISQGNASVKLKDSMKALQWLADHMDLATEEQRARIDQLRAQTDHLTGDDMELEDTSGTDGDIYG